jgi:hypothetical protein
MTIFKPDGIRPVYCRDCLSKKKEEKRLELEQRHLAKEEENKTLTDFVKPTVASLSLGDLNNLKPRDFKGREIKSDRLAPSVAKPAQSTPSAIIANTSTEQELKEGEAVIFGGNS